MTLRFTVATSAATIVLFLALHGSQNGGGGGGVDAIAPQDKVKNFTRRYVTPFLTDDQLYQISKLIAQGMYAESPQDVIYSALYAYMMDGVTSTQLSSMAQYLLCFMFSGMGQSAVLSAADVAAIAIGKRLKAVYNQTLTKIRSMKADSRGPNACYQQVYRINAQFLSQSNVCIMMAGVKTTMPATNWATIRKCLGSVIRYSNCGY